MELIRLAVVVITDIVEYASAFVGKGQVFFAVGWEAAVRAKPPVAVKRYPSRLAALIVNDFVGGAVGQLADIAAVYSGFTDILR